MKEINFSKGVRGKHAGTALKVLGSGEAAWAVCVTDKAKELVNFKLYQIERFKGSDEVRVRGEQGEYSYFPESWFAPVEVPTRTRDILEKAA
jgi:hypothetical protein